MGFPFVVAGKKGLVTILPRLQKKDGGQEVKLSKDLDDFAKIQLS